MSTQHANIADADRHEPKGASTATSGQWYISDGAASGIWKELIKKYTVNWSPAQVSANTTAEQTVAVTGLLLASDIIIGISKPTAQAGLGIVGWRVSANDTLAITFSNNTASPITPTASQTYTIIVYKG